MRYKDYTVTFQSSKRPTLTERGERHTVRLVVPFPRDFKGITEGTVSFKVKRKGEQAVEIPPYPFPSEDNFPMWMEDNTLYIVLWDELTACEHIQFCLMAEREYKGIPQRVYSPDSEMMWFTDHIGLMDVPAPAGLISELLRRLPIFRRFGEKNGKLTYDGKPVGGWDPSNKKVLKELGDDDGALTYRGVPISGAGDAITELAEAKHTHPNTAALDKLGEDATGAPTWDGGPWPGGSGSGLEFATDSDIDAMFEGGIAGGENTGGETSPCGCGQDIEFATDEDIDAMFEPAG